MKKLQHTDFRVQEAIRLYLSGMAVRSICKEVKMDGGALRKILIEQGLLRKRAEAIRIGKLSAKVNDDILDILTPEVCYWIGFLYADGHIEKEPRKRITVTLAEVDKQHLVKFNNFFSDGNLVIREVTPKDPYKNAPRGQINFDKKYYRVGFSSEKIYNKLKELGFTNNKTFYIVPDKLLKWSRDFWRGAVDGDGWLCKSGDKRADGKYNYNIIGLSGTKETLDAFLYYIKMTGTETNALPHKDKNANVWKIEFHHNIANPIMKNLYKDATIYLDRKYEQYLLMKEDK